MIFAVAGSTIGLIVVITGAVIATVYWMIFTYSNRLMLKRINMTDEELKASNKRVLKEFKRISVSRSDQIVE